MATIGCPLSRFTILYIIVININGMCMIYISNDRHIKTRCSFSQVVYCVFGMWIIHEGKLLLNIRMRFCSNRNCITIQMIRSGIGRF